MGRPIKGAKRCWVLFEPIPLYDEVARFITPFTLVALLAEIVYRWGGDDAEIQQPRLPTILRPGSVEQIN